MRVDGVLNADDQSAGAEIASRADPQAAPSRHDRLPAGRANLVRGGRFALGAGLLPDKDQPARFGSDSRSSDFFHNRFSLRFRLFISSQLS